MTVAPDRNWLDRDWLDRHPLPVHKSGTDKNSRGRVLLVGGARFVPGALRLTGEAALRAGAGKLQMATVADVAMHVGVLVPEAAMIALPADSDGEIGPDALSLIEQALAHCDAFILGPGMSKTEHSQSLVHAALAHPRDGLSIVLDAAAITVCSEIAERISAHDGRVVMTPHHGEMASLTGKDIRDIAANPQEAASDVARRFGAVVALKADRTCVAAPDGRMIVYKGGGVGLATGGSGDVLAGLVGGLLARGADPLTATAWGVWLHGEAGRLIGETLGPIGLLARDLLMPIPRLMGTSAPRTSIGFA